MQNLTRNECTNNKTEKNTTLGVVSIWLNRKKDVQECDATEAQ